MKPNSVPLICAQRNKANNKNEAEKAFRFSGLKYPCQRKNQRKTAIILINNGADIDNVITRTDKIYISSIAKQAI